MLKIGLDKTLNESLKVIKVETALPNCIQLYDFCGLNSGFSFEKITKGQIDIEHIGLAKLVYEKACSTFYTTKVNEDGSKEKIFEPLPKGYHISDCLNEFSPEVLSWYRDRNGEPLKMVNPLEGTCIKPDLTKYEKYCSLGQKEDDIQNVSRLNAVDDAIGMAIKMYGEELLSTGKSENEINQIKLEENYFRILNLDKFCKQATEDDGFYARLANDKVIGLDANQTTSEDLLVE